MKVSIFTLLLSCVFFIVQCSTPIKNQAIRTVHIYGNCGMCQNAIEKAGYLRGEALINWDKESKMAVVQYDSLMTNPEEILKRVALAGYDNEMFLAPDDVYNALPNCCQYERKNKTSMPPLMKDSVMDLESQIPEHETQIKNVPPENQLAEILKHYFILKDALVNSSGNQASAEAKQMSEAIRKVNEDKLSKEERQIWKQVYENLWSDVNQIAKTNDLEEQRKYFIRLSSSMYEVLKQSSFDKPAFYQHCPMADDGNGAHWLSKENKIKNPYFGSKMLTCGKTVEKIE